MNAEMADPSNEIRRLAEKELSLARGDEIFFICEQFKLPKSGSNAEKVKRVLNLTIEDIAQALIVARQLRFSDVAESELRREALIEILDKYGLPKSGSKMDMLIVLISNGKLNVEESMSKLNVQSVKRVFEGLLDRHSLAPENDLRLEIIKWVEVEPLMRDFKVSLKKPVPISTQVPETLTDVETPRPAFIDYNIYPTPMPPDSAFAKLEYKKESPWGEMVNVPRKKCKWKLSSRKKLTDSQARNNWAVFLGFFFGGFAIIGSKDVLSNAFGLTGSFLFVVLGTICIILAFVLPSIMYIRAKG